MIKDTRYIIKRVIIGVLISLILSFIYACDVKAETIQCDAGLKLNGSNVTKNSTTTLASGTNYTLQMVAPGVIGRDVFVDGQYYTDYTIVTNIAFGNYTGSYQNSAFSLLNLNYKSNALGFGSNDGVWRIRVLWTASDDIEREDDLIHVLSPSVYNYGGSVNYLGGMRLLDITCGEQASMPTNGETDAAVLKAFSDLQSSINNQNTTINNQTTIISGDLNDIENAINGGNATNRQYQQATTDAINNGTEDITSSIDESTDKTIESQKVCNVIDKKNIKEDNKALQPNGILQNNNDFGITNYIKINKNTEIKRIVNTSYNAYFCFYNINKTLIRCETNNNVSNNQPLIIPNDTSYIRFTINKLVNQPQFEICKNGNQATNDSINEVNDTLNDSNIDDASSDLSEMDSKIATNSVISDLLLLPVTLFQNILNSINGSCSTFNLGSLFGSNLSLPCINLPNILGSNLYGVIDILLCGIFILSMRKKFVDIFQNITSLKDRGNELE